MMPVLRRITGPRRGSRIALGGHVIGFGAEIPATLCRCGVSRRADLLDVRAVTAVHSARLRRCRCRPIRVHALTVVSPGEVW